MAIHNFPQLYSGAMSSLNQAVSGNTINPALLKSGLESLRSLCDQRSIGHTIPPILPTDRQSLQRILVNNQHLLVSPGESIARAINRMTGDPIASIPDEFRSSASGDPLQNLRRLLGANPRAFATAYQAPQAKGPAQPPPLPRAGHAAHPRPPTQARVDKRIETDRTTPILPVALSLPNNDTDTEGFLWIIMKGEGGQDVLVRSPYRIIKPLGSGGMADVFLAEDTDTGTLVAIKKVQEDKATQYILSVFEDEKRCQGRIPDTSRLVKVYAAGRTARNLPFMATELMPGGDLESYIIQIKAGNYLRDLRSSQILTADESSEKAGLERMIVLSEEMDRCADASRMTSLKNEFDTLREAISVTRESPLKRFYGETWNLERMIDVGADVIAGIAALHQAGLVHRDIKPENILLDRNEKEKPFTPKTADLGGTVSKGYFKDGELFGTPDYMAPETYNNKSADPTRDVYALGALLWSLLTLQRLLNGSTLQAVMMDSFKASQDGRCPSKTAPEHSIPPIFDQILQKCIAADPNQRFASAKELLEKWTTALGDQELRNSLSIQEIHDKKEKMNNALGHYLKAFQKHPLPSTKQKIAHTAMLLWNMANEVGDLQAMSTMATIIDAHDDQGDHRKRIHQPVSYKIELDGNIPHGALARASVKTHRKTFVDGKLVIHPTGTTELISHDDLLSLPPGEIRTLNIEVFDPGTQQYTHYPVSIPLPVQSSPSPHQIRVPLYAIDIIPQGFAVVPAGKAIILQEGDGKGNLGALDSTHRQRAIKHDFAIGNKITNSQCFEWLQYLAIEIREGRLHKRILNDAIPSHWNSTFSLVLGSLIDDGGDFISRDDLTLQDTHGKLLRWDEPVTHMDYDMGLALMKHFYGDMCRYPTAPEWTIACVGSESLRRFPWGDSDNPTGMTPPAVETYGWQLGNFGLGSIPLTPDVGSGVLPWDMSPYSPQNVVGEHVALVGFLMSGTMTYLDNFHPRYFFKLPEVVETLKSEPDRFDEFKRMYRLVAGRPYTETPTRRDILNFLKDRHHDVGLIPVIPLNPVSIPGEA